MSQSNPVQSGGFKENMTGLLQKYGSPLELLSVTILFLAIVFIPKLSPSLTKQANTTLGRLFGVTATYLVVQHYGWTIGLVFALLVALLIGAGNNTSLQEAFNAEIRVIPTNTKWFVEKVLGENPTIMEEETVKTQPIQDSSGKNSNTSVGVLGGVQNTSVST